MSFHCLLVIVALCSALRDKPVAILAGVHAASGSADWALTRERMSATGIETDPLYRPFVHNNAAIAAEGIVEVAGYAWLASKMHRSNHRVFRATYWIPQAAAICLHIEGAAFYPTHPHLKGVTNHATR